MEFKIVARHFFKNHLNCVALSVKSCVDTNKQKDEALERKRQRGQAKTTLRRWWG